MSLSISLTTLPIGQTHGLNLEYKGQKTILRVYENVSGLYFASLLRLVSDTRRISAYKQCFKCIFRQSGIAVKLFWNIFKEMTVMEKDLLLIFSSSFVIIFLLMFLLCEISAARHKKENKERDEEMSDLIHDIKAPLNSIKGFAGGLLDKTISQSEEEKYLGIIKSEAERVAKMAEDYAVYKKLDSSRLVKDSIKLYDLICEIILSFEKSITDKNIELKGLDKIEASDVKNLEIMGDRHLLHRAFYNIILNAVNYTPEGGEISLRIKSGSKTVSVSLSNTGDLSEEEVNKIFARNYRLGNSKDKKGTGLGLSIVKKIVILHKGEAKAMSENGKITLKVTLPKK